MRYTLAIFDLDGTLIDSFPWFLRIVNDVADKYRFARIEIGNVDELRQLGPRELMRRLNVPFWKLPAIAAHMRALKHDHIHELALFPGAEPSLRALRRNGMTLTLVTSDSEENARRQLGGAAALFSHFACGASLFGKAAKFNSVVRRAGVAPSQAIAIGDEVRDIEAARAAGIDCAAVTWGYAMPQALLALKPDMVFGRMEEITRLINP